MTARVAHAVLQHRGAQVRLRCVEWFRLFAEHAREGTAQSASNGVGASTSGRAFDVYDSSGAKGLHYVQQRLQRRYQVGNILAGLLALGGGALTVWAFHDPEKGKYAADVPFANWSGTHEVTCKRVYEPESEEEVVRLMQKAIGEGWRLRPIGSALSPNGLGLSPDCIVDMGLMDKVLGVDPEKKQVRVQAGARVADVVEALRPHGLTLQNFASVREQQIGGFTQVSAHGTGASLPPVDEQVVSLRLVAPGLGGAVEVAKGAPSFDWVRVGLGALGIVTEVTLQCVDAHRLLERTMVATRAQVRRHHKRWLRQSKHLRYMWIPYTDAVVVVQSSPSRRAEAPGEGFLMPSYSPNERVAPLVDLARSASPPVQRADADLDGLTAMQLRDLLIAQNPLDARWIARVNAAEAEFWRRSAGYRMGWSDEILGFDCGGQQWVLEVAFPTGGTAKAPTTKELDYVEELLAAIEERGIAAPAPIEQRWTASSTAPMSPAHSDRAEDVHSWVGIIMYLPTDDAEQRAGITAAFEDYTRLCERELMPRYGAKWHWAKLEPGSDQERQAWIRGYVRDHYDVAKFNQARHALDPENNLGNEWLNAVLPLTRS